MSSGHPRRAVAPLRYFTPMQARALLPEVKPLLQALREAHHDLGFAHDQWQDLGRMHGPALHAPDHPDAAEAERWHARIREHSHRVGAILQALGAMGVEVKDPSTGHIELYAKRGDETVLLCYRDDEPTVDHWHALTTGHQARRPLSEF